MFLLVYTTFAKMYYFSFSFYIFAHLYCQRYSIWIHFVKLQSASFYGRCVCVYVCVHMWNMQIFKYIFNSWFLDNTWYLVLKSDGTPLFNRKDLTPVRVVSLMRARPGTGPCMISFCYHNRTLRSLFLFQIWQIKKLMLREVKLCTNKLY